MNPADQKNNDVADQTNTFADHFTNSQKIHQCEQKQG
jgi:hypothetical protein